MIGSPSFRQRRSGVILVVVVSLLALFAVVGLGYVIYAETAATASRLQVSSQVYVDDRATIEPELILNRALGALIYDHPDDQTGVYSALRGHSLARSMYGNRGVVQVPDPTDPNPRPRNILINTDTVPFNGIGRYRYTDLFSGLTSDQILNFTYFRTDSIIRDPEKYPINPTQSNAYRLPSTLSNPNSAPTRWFGGYNAPYTYPDTNNVFLGAVRASDGQVLIPSFHRPYLFLGPAGNTDATFLANTTHPDWYKPSGRLKLLRPRPIDQVRLTDPRQQQIWAANGNPPYPPTEMITNSQLSQYSNATRALINAGLIMPYPTEMGGDVKNLLGAPGGNDSIWMDIGLPVRLTKSGKKFKPLVAFLITDLDGRINLNVHGNLRGDLVSGYTPGLHQHASNQGLGRWEVNPMHVLNTSSLPAMQEYQNLFKGNNSIPGRYTTSVVPNYPRPFVMIGTQQLDLSSMGSSFLNPPNAQDVATTQYQFGASTNPGVTQLSSNLSMPDWRNEPPYLRIDFDGANESLPTRSRSEAPFARAFNVNTQPLTLSSFPDYYTGPVLGIAAGYGNECTYPIDLSTSELLNSPMLYNPLRNTGNSRLLDAMETHNLIARYNSPLDIGDSLLSKLLPQNLMSATNPLESMRIRHRITMVSADVGRAGMMSQTFQLATSPASWTIPMAPPTATMPLAQQGEVFPNLGQVPPFGPQSPSLAASSDFTGTPLFAFTPGQPNRGGTRAPVIVPGDPKSTPILTYDGRFAPADVAGRLDLNRPLPPYPPLDFQANGVSYGPPSPTTNQRIQQANSARQEFAEEIFARLRAAVGAPAMGPNLPPPTHGSPEYKALKYLAQLAVNIVDDIDEDDVMTAFQWQLNTSAPNPTEIVWGVEMPKVTINELYVEQTNGDGGATYLQDASPSPNKRVLKYQINTWVELHNTMVPPFAKDVDPVKYANFVARHRVFLKNNIPGAGDVSTYRLMLLRDQTPVPGESEVPTTELNANPPPMTPEDPPMPLTNTKVIRFTDDMMAPATIDPIDTSTASGACSYRCTDNKTGFYVCGPNVTNVAMHGTTPPLVPGQPESLKSDKLSYNIDPGGTPQKPTVVLQRLANPYLPYNPASNPYVTVDVMRTNERVAEGETALLRVINRRYQYNSPTGGPPQPAPDNEKMSVMRKQPFAGAFAHLQRNMPAGTDKLTFFAHNGNNATSVPATLPDGELERFDWYIHHDRKLTSPVELIHVAAVAPWDITKSFIRLDPNNAGQKIRQGHTAPWLDKFDQYAVTPTPGLPPTYNGAKIPIAAPGASIRLYRALEQFRIGDRTVEMAFGGRDLGKVNINTIWDKEVFNAICDAVAGNQLDAKRGFTQADVDRVWAALTDKTYNLAARTPLLNLTDRTTGAAASQYIDPYTLVPTAFGPTYGRISRFDQPFWGMGAPHVQPSQQYVPIPTAASSPTQIMNAGIEASLFRTLTPDPSLTGNPLYPIPPKRKLVFDVESQTGAQIAQQAAVDPTLASMTHPLLEKSLMSKIFEHLTTRSNVFAVYMTVGYFEVIDDTQKPELLGDEIGMLRDANNGSIVENKSIRHRMFAIVDRTNLSLQPPRYIPSNTQWVAQTQDLQKQGPAPFFYTVPIRPLTIGPTTFWNLELPVTAFEGAAAPGFASSITGVYNGMSWQLKPLNVLYVGSGQEQRRMVIRQMQVTQQMAADGVTPILTASITLGVPPITGGNNWPKMDNPPPHPELITNVISGNPGPQPDFDHRMPNYRGVVLYSVIMD